MQNLAINPKRLWDTLMETAQIGGTPKGGICRLTLSDPDRQIRDWLKSAVEALGCSVTVDEVGNMFVLRPGGCNELAPIAIGSHLDTQPTGGKFDGVLGVIGGLEVLRTLHDLGYQTHAPLMLVNWTNEEGSRFAPAMLGSGVYAGVFDRAYADSRTDRQGVTFGKAIETIGYRGDARAGSIRFGAMFELHIEQGPVLEEEGKAIGIVTGVQGMRWYDVELTGRESHSGSTPMRLRKDALLGAARLIERVETIAQMNAPGGVGTVGCVEVTPNSRNVIPGHVFLSVDLRHPDERALDPMERQLMDAVASVAAATGIKAEARTVWDSVAIKFDPQCIASVRSGAETAGYAVRDIVSGAGHDAVYAARVAPTTMIFVPCASGLSHNEEESVSSDQCAAGTQVLLNAVLDYDRHHHLKGAPGALEAHDRHGGSSERV